MFAKPYRVETWFERDRSSIVVYDADDREIAEWWDDDVQDMFESGYFTPGRGERVLADSVLAYIEEMKLDKPARLPYAKETLTKAMGKWPKKNPPRLMYHLPYRYEVQFTEHGKLFGEPLKFISEQAVSDFMKSYPKMKMKWMKKLSPDISVEKNPPHWGYTMGELAAATRHLKSLQLHFTPEEIQRETGIAPQIQASMLRGGSVYSGAPEALSKMYHEKVSQNNPGDVHLDIDIGSHNAARGGRTRVNPPLEILSDKIEGKYRILHYRVTIQLKGSKDVERILQTLYPAWRVVSHYSLRAGAYPGIAHAYGVQMEMKNRKNPPLPASALMDISTAKTVVREVDSGARPPRPALSQADDLLDRGLQKLRGSHLGNVDWSNPPATEVYRNIVEIKAVKPDGKRYVHKFDSGSHILGLANGDLLIQSRKGKRLWKNFKAGGE
jgi:hypothetical protein